MNLPFTATEIKEAANRLGTNKSPDSEGVQGEHIKYATHEIHKEIAAMLNDIARTGNFPKELQLGLLIPLQKPGKAKVQWKIQDQLFYSQY